METAIMNQESHDEIIERVLIAGDLSKLLPAERVSYYRAVCESVGLNPLTKPFDYINLGGKLVLYAKKDCTEQLRKIHGVSIVKLERDKIDGVYIVTAYAAMNDGRQDSSTGAVNMENLKGDVLANAVMKAETKAKRRVTLSICGLGFLDEIELETTPTKPVIVNENGDLGPQWTEQAAATRTAKSWPAELITWAVQEYGVKSQQAVAALNKSELLTPDLPIERQKHWMSIYRTERNANIESGEAAKRADADLQATIESA